MALAILCIACNKRRWGEGGGRSDEGEGEGRGEWGRERKMREGKRRIGRRRGGEGAQTYFDQVILAC